VSCPVFVSGELELRDALALEDGNVVAAVQQVALAVPR
jgi:hypothetical protein